MGYYKKGLKGKLDETFSLYIRNRDKWTCQRCGKKQERGSRGYHAAHIEGRGKESVRWDEKNVFGICKGCHQFLDTYHSEKVHWYTRKFGEKEHRSLLARARGLSHHKPYEIEGLITHYKGKLEEIKK